PSPPAAATRPAAGDRATVPDAVTGRAGPRPAAGLFPPLGPDSPGTDALENDPAGIRARQRCRPGWPGFAWQSQKRDRAAAAWRLQWSPAPLPWPPAARSGSWAWRG